MSLPKDRENDWIQKGKNSLSISVITPRVLLVEPNGYTPLIRHHGWLGLMGGHITLEESERLKDKNLLDPDIIAPTIVREVQEEANADIGPYVRTSAAMLGLAEVHIIDFVRPLFTHATIPIMICKIPGNLPFRGAIEKVPPHRLPLKTFPDAAMALIHREQMHRKGATGPIIPDWLNKWGEIIFETHPDKRYIKGTPPVVEYSHGTQTPPIPRTYPPHIRRWLIQQYRKM